MKGYCYTLVFFFMGTSLFGQFEFNMTSNGFGNSEENAIQNAIVSSLNQVFGMFYSSNTLISNDSLVIDDFAKVNRGNIKEIKSISTEEISLNKWFANVNITISLTDIDKYYQSVGEKLKYEGSLYSFNIQLMELNELNETKSICNMIEVANEITSNLFDYSLTYSNPISIDEISENWLVNFHVNATINQNIISFRNTLRKTMRGLSLSQTEIENYTKLGKQTYSVHILENGKWEDYYFRSPNSLNIISNFINSWEGYVRSFDIVCGSDIKIVRGNLLKNKISSFNNLNFERDFEFNNKIDVQKININESPTSIKFSIPDSNKLIGIFDWFEFFNFNELEKIDTYKITANRLLKFKNGGYVVFEKNMHGIVLSPFEFSTEEFYANDNIQIGLYNDWIIPSYEDFLLINEYIYQNYFCNLKEEKNYETSSSEIDTDSKYEWKISIEFRDDENEGRIMLKKQNHFNERVILIRKF